MFNSPALGHAVPPLRLESMRHKGYQGSAEFTWKEAFEYAAISNDTWDDFCQGVMGLQTKDCASNPFNGDPNIYHDGTVDIVKALGSIAKELLGINDAVRCGHGNVLSCAWTVLSVVPIGRLSKLGKLGEALAKTGEAAKDGDHIALGRTEIVADFANSVGARDVMRQAPGEWRASISGGAYDPNTKFSVSLDGITGRDRAILRGRYKEAGMNTAVDGQRPSWFDWEMYTLDEANAWGRVTFYENGNVVSYPFK
jgi:hypothetical protein